MPTPNWPVYADSELAGLCRLRTGRITAITGWPVYADTSANSPAPRWPDYADTEVAGLCRSLTDAETLLSAVAESFGATSGEIEARQDQPAFQAWVYLMRRAANLSLNEVAGRARVSVGRVSQIQSSLEAGGRTARLMNLLDRYKVRN